MSEKNINSKIGIITYHRAHNIGAVLQAYALLYYLKSIGLNAKIIDYWPAYRKGMYDIINFGFLRKRNFKYIVKTMIFIILNLPLKIIRYLRFKCFIKRQLFTVSSKKFKSVNEMPSSFDVYIYGSDQIWRYSKEYGDGFDEAYFGVYTKKERNFTYAASMGIIDEKNINIALLQKWLSNFKMISVREINLKNFIKRNFNIDCNLVLDPAFLVNTEHWESFSKSQRHKNEYLLHYELNKSDKSEGLARLIAQKYNLRIKKYTGGVTNFDFFNNWVNGSGPKEMLALIKNASYVVSTSYHGVIFSIIFRKNFYTLGFGNNSDRVLSLLNLLKLERRYVRNGQDIEMKNIDYTEVNKILDRQIELSKNFINQIIDKQLEKT